MDTSSNLQLPFIMPGQAQKHVTHNEAIRMLDAIVHLAVIDRGLTAPPTDPAEGDRYVVASNGSGSWTGRDGDVAAFQDGAWAFFTPRPGWMVWVADESVALVWDGNDWQPIGPTDAGSGATSINPAERVGVNTTADAVNRLAVKSDAVLLSHDDVTPGSGDIRLTLNKASSGGTATMLYQTGFGGRAEMGLAGDDSWRLKVTQDGVTWRNAIEVDPESGAVALPTTPPVSNPLNLLNDGGRFSGTPEPQSIRVSSFTVPNWLTGRIGMTLSEGPAFIHNNSDYGGSDGTLDPLVRALVEKVRSPASASFRRYGVEYFLCRCDFGAGQEGAYTSALDGIERFIPFTNRSYPIPSQVTGNLHIRVSSGSVLMRKTTDVAHYYDGHRDDEDRLITDADGWVQISALHNRPAAEFVGYTNQIWRCYAEPNSVFHLALPMISPGHIPIGPGTYYGAIPSAGVWR